jgi:hypothetical protein
VEQEPDERPTVSIVIHIKPEAEAELTRQAAAHGVQPEDYAATLIEEALHDLDLSEKPLTSDQLNRTLQELAQFSGKIPILPDEAFTGEGLYRDHD